MDCLFKHRWTNCKCERCGKIRDNEHDFRAIDGICEEKCVICGKTHEIEHQWEGCRCKRCGQTRDTGHNWDGERCTICSAPNPNIFYLEVSNKYSAYGGMFFEGKMKYGQLRVGDGVYVYDEKGRLKYENVIVSGINDKNGIQTNALKAGNGTYAAIMLNGLRNIGDIDYKDIITKQKLAFETLAQEDPTAEEKVLPQAKTYNHTDRKTHINMATNDIAAMCASGSLASNREWIRNVGQDLFDAHGFTAMQEVFINLKTRYPVVQSQLSSIWDGVGGWAD